MKALIGVDGSTGSGAAVELAARILSSQTDELLLYYAPPLVRFWHGRRPPAETADRIQLYLVEAVFGTARRQLPTSLQHRVTKEIVGTQSPAHGLLVAADEHRADMIVIGARGTGPIRGLSVGSVAQAVARHATIPVMIVHPYPKGDTTDRLRVLLASDGSKASKHACEVINQFSWPTTTVGRVINVIESSVAQVPKWVRDQLDQQDADSLGFGHLEPTEAERKQVQEGLLDWCGQLPAIFAGQEPLVAVGQPSNEILKAIESQDIDLVIVGARRLGPMGRALHGSTSEHLLSQARCSVLVVPLHEKP
jgi:nucleotide-binding universal stress UspA family protein